MLDFIHSMTTDHPYWMMAISFTLAVLTDAIWTKWSHATTKHQAVYAANWSVLMYIFGIVYTLVVMEKAVLQILAYVVGAWVGTYLTILHIKNGETNVLHND
jgi:hypothetical protein